METNKPKEITKKIAINRTIVILLGTIIFVLAGSYLMYGKIPSIVFVILLFFIPFMILCAFLGFKYRNKINSPKSKFWYVYIGIGALMALINLIIILRKESTSTNYINILVGIAMIIYAIRIKNKQKKLANIE